MIIQCSSCGAKFRFDENKITGGGVKLKCSKCNTIFLVTRPAEEVEQEAPAPPKPVPPPSPPRSPAQPQVNCPYCTKSISAETHFCPHCGEDVTRRKVGAVRPQPQQVNCQACRKPNPADSRFCVHCGASLLKPPGPADTLQDKVICLKCGAELPPKTKFCPECGSSQSKSEADKQKVADNMRQMYKKQGLDSSSEASGTLFPFTAWDEDGSGEGGGSTGLEKKLIMTLRVISGANEGAEYTLSKKYTTIGRVEADIIIDDFKTSRNHAAIEILKHKFLIKDLDSTNGTFVNDQLTPAEFLTNGDEIRIGDTVYKVIIEEESLI